MSPSGRVAAPTHKGRLARRLAYELASHGPVRASSYLVAQIYSQTFLQAHNFSGDSSELQPTAGFIWVIRGLDVVNGEALNNFMLKGAGGQVIWVAGFAAPVGFDYASYRGRYVVEPGEYVTIHSTEALDVSMWGYNLTTP